MQRISWLGEYLSDSRTECSAWSQLRLIKYKAKKINPLYHRSMSAILNGEIIRVWQMIITDKSAYENSELAIC